jgi:hypothetical protein
MHGLAVLGLVIIIFIIIITRRVSGLASSTSQCANCPTKPPGTYYTVVNGCTTGACITCPAVQNGINLLTTPCADATATAPSGIPGACTLTCNTGYSKSTDGLSCVPDCVGEWGALCSTSCGPGVFTYEVKTPAGPGGKACKDPDGTVRSDGDTKPCANPDCGTPCEGSWSAYGTCSAHCGYATKTREFTATKQARNGGTACESTYGLNAHWPESYETTTCTDLPACTSGEACQGSWSDWGACSAPCDGGIRKKTYNVTRAATVGTDGTRGAACPYADGEQQQEACNTQTCCSTATIGDWEKYGSVTCSGKSSGKPEQNWARNIVFPSGTPVNTTAKSCSIQQFYTKYTAAGCPDVAPTAGTCAVTGVIWNAIDGCKLTPATVAPTDGTCDFPTGVDVAFKQVWDASLARLRDIKPTDAGGCKLTPEINADDGQGTCSDGGVYSGSSGCLADPRRGNTNPKGVILSMNCPTGYTANISKNKCIATPVSAKTLACPVNYTADLPNNTCKANPVSITGLTCPTPYWSENRTINKCSATTTGDEAPKKTATGD